MPLDRVQEAFTVWESQGRGWHVFDVPVETAPPVAAWATPGPSAEQDDGKILHPLRRLQRFLGGPGGEGRSKSHEESGSVPEYLHGPLEAELGFLLPLDLEVSRGAVAAWLGGLSPGLGPFSFELIGSRGKVRVQVVVRRGSSRVSQQQLKAHFPNMSVLPGEGFLATQWPDSGEACVVELGLDQPFLLPLQVFGTLNPDPLTGVIAALSSFGDDECGVVQVLFDLADPGWAEMGRFLATSALGSPQEGRTAIQKLSSPLYGVVCRLATKASTHGQAELLLSRLAGEFVAFSNPLSNRLVPLENTGYPDELHELDLLDRMTHRLGMLLGRDELNGLVHPPGKSVQLAELERLHRPTKGVPGNLPSDGLLLGVNLHEGVSQEVRLSEDQRSRHAYLIGASGTGKSTLMLSCILQDLQAGRGLAVIDPHGDLIDDILGRMPAHRIDDVILVDPGDSGYPVGFNVLEAHSELEKTLLASDLVASFRQLSTSWGDQMNSVLANAILTFLERPEGGTLPELRRFLVEPAFRAEVLETVEDPEVVYYWKKQFPLLTGKPQGPILTRLDAFLRPKVLRQMVSQKEGTLDLGQIMNQGQVLLARLSLGAIGRENSYLLGSFLVSRLQQMALSRQELGAEERRPFYLYIDEFQNFVTPSLAEMLSGARKYRLGLVLAHQDLRQISSRDTELLSSVLSNPYTRVCFRVGDQDARLLEGGFSSFSARDLQSLGTGQAICRLGRADWDFSLDTSPASEVDPEVAARRREQVIHRSRERFARQRPAGEFTVLKASVSAPEEKIAAPREQELIPAPPKPRPARVVPGPPEPSSGGRGGRQHRYLQELLKRWGEANGYRASLEEPIHSGLGLVDLLLQAQGKSIAIEIGVASNREQEVKNIQKCLAAGISQVLFVSPDRRLRAAVRKEVPQVVSREQVVEVVAPEEAIAVLEAWSAAGETETHEIRGYKVTTSRKGLKSEEAVARQAAVSRVIAKALKRQKGK